MKNPLSEELIVVVWCVLCGQVSGIWYDFFKAIRKSGANSNIAVTIQDVIFWIGETVIVYSVLFLANNGVLRWYEFFFIVFGFALYRWLLSDFIVAVWKKLFVFAKGLLKIIFMPIKISLKFLKSHKKTKIARFIRRIFKKQQ